MRGRIRTVKPEIFTDEDLWDLGVETGLPVFQGFEGLWCYADKEGRFEWRPRALKTVILPYWSGDFSRVLDALVTRGFVVKYASEGREYGLVRTFKRHQVINNKEAESDLPPPPPDVAQDEVIAGTSTRAPRVGDASTTPLGLTQVEGKGKEGKGKEGNNTRERAVVSPLDHPKPILADIPGMQLAIGRAAFELEWVPAPELSLNHLRVAAERAAKAATARGLSRDEAASALAVAALRAARERGKPDQAGWLLTTIEPWAPEGSQAPSRARALGTNPEDFADVPSLDEQRARARAVAAKRKEQS